jgi:hypothetical protein
MTLTQLCIDEYENCDLFFVVFATYVLQVFLATAQHPTPLHPTQYIIISQGQRHLKTHAVNTKNDVCVYSMCFQRFSMQQNSGSQQCRQMQAMEASEQAAAKKEIANTITLPIRARSLQSVKMHQLHF